MSLCKKTFRLLSKNGEKNSSRQVTLRMNLVPGNSRVQSLRDQETSPQEFKSLLNVPDFSNVFMNMGSGVAPSHGGQDQNTRPSGQSSHERAGPSMPIDISQLLQGFNVSGMTQQGAQPEMRMDGSINLDFQQLPAELSGILGSVADRFSTHDGQRSNNGS